VVKDCPPDSRPKVIRQDTDDYTTATSISQAKSDRNKLTGRAHEGKLLIGRKDQMSWIKTKENLMSEKERAKKMREENNRKVARQYRLDRSNYAAPKSSMADIIVFKKPENKNEDN